MIKEKPTIYTLPGNIPFNYLDPQLVLLEGNAFIPVEFNPTQETEYDVANWRRFVRDVPVKHKNTKNILEITNISEEIRPIPFHELQLVGVANLTPFSYDVFYAGKRPDAISSSAELVTRLCESYEQARRIVKSNHPYFALNFATTHIDEEVKQSFWEKYVQSKEPPILDKVRHTTAYPTVNMYRRVPSFEDRLDAAFEKLLEKAAMQSIMKSFGETETILSRVAKEIEK